MDMNRGPAFRTIIAAILIMTAVGYVACYFVTSKVEMTPMGEARVFASEGAHDIYTPLRWFEETVLSRPTMFE